MPKIIIPYASNRRLVLTHEEALALLHATQKALAKFDEHHNELRPVNLRDGFFTRDDLFAFFAQIYPAHSQLKVHVGRICTSLMHSVHDKNIPVPPQAVLCGECGETLTKYRCSNDTKNHWSYSYYKTYRFNATVIQANVDSILKTKRFGKDLFPRSTRDDFLLLIHHL